MLCYFSHSIVRHGNAWVFGKILTWAKWKWEHEYNISSLRCSNTFTFQFGLVWSWRMCWKFFPCSCLKLSWSGLFSFGDMSNAPKCLAKFPLSLIIIWKIWNKCIMLVLDYFMERRIKHYWLTMNLPKRFRIRSGVVFFLNHLGDKCCQRTRCNGWTSHHICGHRCLNCPFLRHFEFIMTIWLNILNLVSVHLQKIIIGLSNISIMIMWCS